LADVAQVLATGATTIVGVSVGAGLTYWLGALNRRHQEAREDKTRWYEARLQAYSELSKLIAEEQRHTRTPKSDEQEFREYISKLQSAGIMIRLVGSAEVLEAFMSLLETSTRLIRTDRDRDQIWAAIANFENAARKDLGAPLLRN
jgi:hypothetical protein